jgi:hydroxymethylglutaryl-CoA reductase (NADPH)
MSTERSKVITFIGSLVESGDIEVLRKRLRPRFDPPSPRIAGGAAASANAIEKRLARLNASPETRSALADQATLDSCERYRANIEHLVGTVKIPVGIAGPLRVNGLFASGDYYVPLATTEAALVASYSRGAELITAAGGCAAVTLNEGVGRAPGFAFESLEQAGMFAAWAATQYEAFQKECSATTSHGSLTGVRTTVEGNHVYLHFEFLTGDASGQNMVTIATERICRFIETASPVRPRYYFVEANLSGDKKASAQSFVSVRGRKVSAELTVPAALIAKRLRTTPARMVDYWRMAALGGVMSGTIGVHGHFANGLAALYIACGQDVAAVAESAIGVTRLEVTDSGDLYAAATLPNLIVGTVGGGTSLPSQRACLDLMGLSGTGHVRALGEVCAAVCLAGELSIIGALCAGEFVRAHAKLARGRKTAPPECQP